MIDPVTKAFKKQYLNDRNKVLKILVSRFVADEIVNKESQHDRIQILITPDGQKQVFYDENTIYKAFVKLRNGIEKKGKGFILMNQL